VLNGSDKAIEVRYQISDFPGPFRAPVTPATKAADELLDGDKPWSELSPSQYGRDPESRTVTVTLMPHSALLVERVHRGGMQVDEADEAATFAINELVVVGDYGEIRLQGKQVRKAFVPESKKAFVLMYK